jgi:hypothetical protein
MPEMFINPNTLVAIYLDELRPLPTDLLLICLQYAGLVRVGHSSLHFWINCRPSWGVRRSGVRFPRRFR